MAMSLEDLKAEVLAADAQTEENAAVETEELEIPQVEEQTIETEAETEETEEAEEVAETSEDEAEEADLEDWMKGDGHESQAVKKFTDGDIGKVKTKLKAKLDKRHNSEIEQLQARIIELETKPLAIKPSELTEPQYADFYESDNQDADYLKAISSHQFKVNNAETAAANATAETARGQQATLDKIAQGVDAHYLRAEKLSTDMGIKPEAYQAADLSFRQSIEDVLPGIGDMIADNFITTLGEGSEKVMYSLGVNSEKRDKFIKLLQEGPNGLRASVYLGKLSEELQTPKKRKTNAPAPADGISGDKSKPAKASHRKLTESIKAAEKSGDLQAVFNARAEARAAGVKIVDL